ncbi:MAG: PQQ-binding-like beta-propeller repeat protein [Armatimonadota bacterium]|jgi:outer membrane protein assembly factor BamB
MIRSTRCTLLLLAALAAASAAGAVDDLTFLHVSDMHVPHAIAQTRATIAEIPFGAPIELEPWGVTAPPVELIVSTGDLNEFSGGRGWWAQYLGLWAEVPVPVYHQPGNHDNTWRCARPDLRELHGGVFYAVERAGVKLIDWDTATPQDPRPSVAEEGLRWLAAEFARTPPEQPVIFLGHHSLDGREFAGAYDRARLLDLLRTRNVVLMLVGHGHSARAWQIEGIDVVMGGSTYGPRRPGYGIVSIRDGVLRVAHQFVDDEAEMIGLLEKPLPPRSPFLPMEVEPVDRIVFGPGEPLRWTVTGAGEAAEGRWTLDGDAASGEMERAGDAWVADLDTATVEPGAHTLRLELTGADGRVSSRSVAFYVNGGAFDVAWRQRLAGSAQSSPTVAGDRIYVGDNGGELSIFAVGDGARLGTVRTAAEVRSDPVLAADGASLLFGSADGHLHAVDRDGGRLWRFDAGGAIYGSPVVAGERAYVGTADGEVFAVNTADGSLLWRSDAPEYAIEQAPAVGAESVFVGSWDRHAYALDAATGEVRWRAPSAGSDREGFVAWYYSPADCAPVAIGDRVFFADRAYRLTVFDAGTGERLLDEERCVAVGPSEDGQFVYVRHTDHRVSKRAADGSTVWVAEAPTGAVPTAPVESHGLVWVLSDRGVLTALEAGSGEVRAQQRVTPDLFAFAAPEFDGERVYVADMGGRLTCFVPAWLGR